MKKINSDLIIYDILFGIFVFIIIVLLLFFIIFLCTHLTLHDFKRLYNIMLNR